MPVPVQRWVRRMRGGAQCHLVEAADGAFYVLKPLNNPQHQRVLINEWICSVFLRYLRIATPESAILEIDEAFGAEPGFDIQLGSRILPVAPGWHFGSRYPGDPATTAVFDFVPSSLLSEVTNRADFLGALAFDQWVSNADARQAVFFRAKVRQPHESAKPGYVAWMIDNGFAFQGPEWRLSDMPGQGRCGSPEVYRRVTGWRDFEPWLELIKHFPEETIDKALREIPVAWLEGAHDALVALLEQLMRRRRRVPDLIESVRDYAPDLFPNWPR